MLIIYFSKTYNKNISLKPNDLHNKKPGTRNELMRVDFRVRLLVRYSAVAFKGSLHVSYLASEAQNLSTLLCMKIESGYKLI